VRGERWFTATAAGVSVRLPGQVREVVGDLAEAVLGLLPPAGDPLFPPEVAPSTPSDPALARLFPAGYGDDDGGEAAAEFRRLTSGGLRDGKAADAGRVRETLQAQALSVDDAEAWLRCLNDVRLVLAARLGLRADGDAEALEAAGRGGQLLALYGVLGATQDDLLEALADGGH